MKTDMVEVVVTVTAPAGPVVVPPPLEFALDVPWELRHAAPVGQAQTGRVQQQTVLVMGYTFARRVPANALPEASSDGAPGGASVIKH